MGQRSADAVNTRKPRGLLLSQGSLLPLSMSPSPLRGRFAWKDCLLLFRFLSEILCSQIMSGKKKRSEVQPLAAVVILCLSVKNAVQDVSYDKGSCLQGTTWKPSNEI